MKFTFLFITVLSSSLRRLRETVSESWGEEEECHVVLAGLANSYTHYITTWEEYQTQRLARLDFWCTVILCQKLLGLFGVGKMLIDKNYGILTEVLRYEAASTIYGPHTLLAYQQQYARITKVAISKSFSQSLFKTKTFRRYLMEKY